MGVEFSEKKCYITVTHVCVRQPYASMNVIGYPIVCDPESTKPGVHVTVVSVEQHSDMPFDLSMLVDAAAPQRLHCEVL